MKPDIVLVLHPDITLIRPVSPSACAFAALRVSPESPGIIQSYWVPSKALDSELEAICNHSLRVEVL